MLRIYKAADRCRRFSRLMVNLWCPRLWLSLDVKILRNDQDFYGNNVHRMDILSRVLLSSWLPFYCQNTLTNRFNSWLVLAWSAFVCLRKWNVCQTGFRPVRLCKALKTKTSQMKASTNLLKRRDPDMWRFPITKTRLFKYIENSTSINWKFSDKKLWYFHNSAQNIDRENSLEPPRRGGSNEYPQSMFLSRNKKNNVYPCKPQFYSIKVGFKGVKII